MKNLPREAVTQIVLEALQNANRGRPDDDQLDTSAEAVLFGDGSSLDSMDLVSLIIDVEEMLADASCHVALSDERAMSMRHSPFRSVTTLVDFVCAQQNEQT